MVSHFFLRNVHCAICNNATLSRLICLNLGPFGRFNWHQNFDSFSFAVLFDIGGDADAAVGGGVGGARPRCRAGELFDPFFKRCRNVVCGDDDEVFVDGRCFNPSRPNTTTASTTTITGAPSAKVVSSTEEAAEEVETTMSPYPESFNSTRSTARTPMTTSPEPSTTPRLISSTSRQHSAEVDSNATSVDEGPAVTEPTPPSEEFLHCPKFALESSEYLLLDGGLVFVERYERSLDASRYQMQDGGRLVICVPEEARLEAGGGKEEEEEITAKFGPGLALVTFLGLGLSSVCCLLHLSAAAITPELRNLSGRNLVSLTAALLGGYLSFMAAMFGGGGGGGDSASCYVLAVSIYFFFLSGFAWMLVISVDIFRTLRRATTQLRLTTGSQWKRFAAYSAAAWTAPAVLACFAVVVDTADGLGTPEEWRPGFASTGLCWFGRKRALLVFFAAPFCAVAAVNVVLFAASACMVYDTTRTSSRHVSSSGAYGPRTNFRLYLRLAVVMGLTWVAGLLAGLLDDSEPAWYAFVALNSLQGVFIFAFFTCKRNVLASVRERLPASLRNCGSLLDGGERSSSEGDPSWRLTNSTKRSSSSSDSNESNGNNKKEGGADLFAVTRGCKTMYTVSSRQVNGAINQKSFDGRYF